MNSQTVTLDMPEQIYQRAKRTAKALRRPVEEVIVDTLSVALPPVDDVPPDMVDEMAAMSTLKDDALWQMARSAMPARQQGRLRTLSAMQSERPLTPSESKKLDELRHEYGRITLLKAQAYALLHERGLYSAVNA